MWVDLEAASAELGRAVEALERGDARSGWALAQVPLNIASRGLLPGAQARWLEPPRRDLEDTRLQALEVIGRAGLRLGGSQLASVERAARALIDAEPYRESGYVLLMEALAARGNVAEGVRVFERLRTLLRDELGTAPSPEAIEAHERLLMPAARAAPGRDEQGGAAAASIELPDELRARAAVPLVGRRRELGELSKLWAQAGGDAPRDGRIVVIAGDAGIGKTSLAAELARRAHGDGGVVLAGRSPEEALVPYQPFLEALRHYVATAPADELRQDDPRLRPGARAAGARAESPARRAAAADRGAGVRALPAVRGGRRPVRGDLRERPDPARARRPALGRPPDAAAAPPPRALARAQPRC